MGLCLPEERGKMESLVDVALGEYPYQDLIETNRKRSREECEEMIALFRKRHPKLDSHVAPICVRPLNWEPAHSRMRLMKAVNYVIGVLVLLCLGGCAGFGPRTVARDRFDYIAAISESWKSQMLINMVKIRYGDAPVFLDVTSVISGYTLEADVGLSGQWWNRPSYTSQTLGATGKFTDRPTITYTPVVGEQFARSMMTPIPPAALVALIQAGYPIDLVFRFCSHSINGIQNSYGGDARKHEADPEFYLLLEKMRKIQDSGALGIRLKRINQEESVVLFFRAKADKTNDADIEIVRKMLGVAPQVQDLKVVYGSLPIDGKEIAILTRSIIDLLTDLASTIEVPARHVEQKRVNPTVQGTVGSLTRIQSSLKKPSDAFVAVPYHDCWFYIDDRDFPSKRVFSFLMFIFTLVETGNKGGGPVVTIPAG
jgi:hypothetical protein